MKKLSKSYLKEIIISGNRTPRLEFKKHFKAEIEQFTEAVFKAYKLYEPIKIKDENDLRVLYVKRYIYKAIQDLISAFNIFINGYLIPAGNLMRQFHESVAAAMLFSNKHLGDFDDFLKDPKNYEFSKVVSRVDRHVLSKKISNVNDEGWKTFKSIYKWYHGLSHSSVFAVSTLLIYEEGNKGIVLGSYFGKGKIPYYSKTLTQMVNAAKILDNIVKGIKEELGDI